jgi:hypothetical protein
MATHTGADLYVWEAWLANYELKEYHREDYYAAQIALEVRRVLHNNPNRLKLKDFLLDFTQSEPATVAPDPGDEWLDDWLDEQYIPPPQPQQSRARRSGAVMADKAAASEAFWLAFCGIDKNTEAA